MRTLSASARPSVVRICTASFKLSWTFFQDVSVADSFFPCTTFCSPHLHCFFQNVPYFFSGRLGCGLFLPLHDPLQSASALLLSKCPVLFFGTSRLRTLSSPTRPFVVRICTASFKLSWTFFRDVSIADSIFPCTMLCCPHLHYFFQIVPDFFSGRLGCGLFLPLHDPLLSASALLLSNCPGLFFGTSPLRTLSSPARSSVVRICTASFKLSWTFFRNVSVADSSPTTQWWCWCNFVRPCRLPCGLLVSHSASPALPSITILQLHDCVDILQLLAIPMLQKYKNISKTDKKSPKTDIILAFCGTLSYLDANKKTCQTEK
ncbi:Uncharacterised protein [uncultured Eubacterium sp.]|nr:Uncharacterised protein [uncultured Eubacterium sp.]